MTGDFIFSGWPEQMLERSGQCGATGGRRAAAFVFAGSIPSRGIGAKTAALPASYVNRQP